MPLIIEDRVRETTTTTGTGAVTLAGAVSGFQSFSAVGNGNTTTYCIAHQTANEWEIGVGTYTSAGTTLSRTNIIASSNADSLVNFSAGTKDVFITLPSQQIDQYVVQKNAYTLTSQIEPQKLFNASTNGAITLPVGTYQFECGFSLSSMSNATGSFGFGFGGTATFTQQWTSFATKAASLSSAATTQSTHNTTADTSIVIASSSTPTGQALIKGILSVTVSGTVIPQVSLTVAAAAIVGAGSYFKITNYNPISSATNLLVGNWS